MDKERLSKLNELDTQIHEFSKMLGYLKLNGSNNRYGKYAYMFGLTYEPGSSCRRYTIYNIYDDKVIKAFTKVLEERLAELEEEFNKL